MQIPQFLLADNTDLPDEIFIIHAEYPRFIWSVNQDEVEWLDDIKGEEDQLVNEITGLLESAEAFYEREMQRLEADLN